MKDRKSPIFPMLAKDFPGIQIFLPSMALSAHLSPAERCHLACSCRILRKSEVTGNHSSIHLRSDRFELTT